MVRGGLLIAVVVGAIVALGGGPVAWAILVMIGVPFGLLLLVRQAGHASNEHPHFAPPPPHR